jgi:cell division protein FtsQ
MRSLMRRSGRTRLMILAAGIAAAGVGAFAVHWSGADARALAAIAEKAYAFTAEAGLGIDEVVVQGRGRASADSVLSALGAKRGAPILAVNLGEARARLEALSWVKNASVERLLPGTLYVRIEERQPLALWQRNGKLELVDRDGKVLPVPRLDEFRTLVVIVGDEAPKQAAQLLELLGVEPELRGHVAAAVLVGGRRWNIRLDNGIDIALPEENPGAAWRELARLDRSDGLLKRDIRRVDLRLPDRLVVQTSQPAPDGAKPAAKKKPAGRST